jgi:hypothetical protein
MREPQLHGSVRDEHQHKVAGFIVITEEVRGESLASERRMVDHRSVEPRMVEAAVPSSHAWWRPPSLRALGHAWLSIVPP